MTQTQHNQTNVEGRSTPVMFERCTLRRKGIMSKGNRNRIVLHEGKGVSSTLVERLTPDERKNEIDELLNDLRASTSRNEGKRIRRALRARGIYVSKLGGVDAIEGSIANAGKPARAKGKGKGKGKTSPAPVANEGGEIPAPVNEGGDDKGE